MTFAYPLGLIALVSVPVVVALYLFQLRGKEKKVSCLFLWQTTAATERAGEKIRRPWITVSLLLELAACVILSLLLAGASCVKRRSLRTETFVLDGSASMSAKVEGRSFKEAGVRKVLEEIENYRPDRIFLIESGDPPKILSGPEDDKKLAVKALRFWNPNGHGHSLSPALNLAKNLASESRIVVITDKFPEEEFPFVDRWISVGEAVGNRAIISARRDPLDHNSDLVHIQVANYGLAGSFKLLVKAFEDLYPQDITKGKVIFRKVCRGEKESVILKVSAEIPLLVAELPEDSLQIDNKVFLPACPRKIVRCLCKLRGMEGKIIERAINAISEAVLIREPPADLAFLPYSALSDFSEDAWIVVFPPFKAEGRSEKVTFVSPYTMDFSDPLLVGVSLTGVLWCADKRHIFPPKIPIIEAEGVPLLYPVPPPLKGYVLNCYLSEGNLAKSIAFPILIHNVVAKVKAELPGPNSSLVQAGSTIRFSLGKQTSKDLVLEGEGWRMSLPYRKELTVALPDKPLLLALKAEGKLLFALGCNWHDAEESDLRGLRAGEKVGFRRKPGEQKSDLQKLVREEPLFWSLLFFSAALLTLNWFLLEKKERR